MISYEPLWETMKKRGISSYQLIHKCGFSGNTIHNLRHNKGISTTTINDLCNVLNCGVADIMLHVPDEEPFRHMEFKKYFW